MPKPLQPGQTRELKLTPAKLRAQADQLKVLVAKYRELKAQRDHAISNMPDDKWNTIDRVLQKYSQAINSAREDIEQGRVQLSRNMAIDGPQDVTKMNAWKKLEAECSDAFALFRQTQKFFMRGTDQNAAAFVGAPRTDRKPMDSDPTFQRMYDKMLQMHGVHARRTNSTFVSTNYTTASSYGDVFIIIPKNGAVYSWSKAARDIVLEHPEQFTRHDRLKKLVDRYESILAQVDIDPQVKSDYVFDLEFEDYDDMIEKIRGYGENLKLLAPRSAQKFLFKLSNLDEDYLFNFDALYRKYQPTSKDIDVAMKREHEIMVMGEYYAINFKQYSDAFLKVLHNPS